MGVNDYISIGNSDDGLSQADWSRFVAEVRDLFKQADTVQIHGEWFANPDQPWQNANWCVEILPPAWWRVAAERAGQDPERKNDPQNSASAVRMRVMEMRRERDSLKRAVRDLCYRWRQDSCAWATAEVEFIETGRAAEREALRETAVVRVTRLLEDHQKETLPAHEPWVQQARAEGWLPGRHSLPGQGGPGLSPPALQDEMRRLLGLCTETETK